MSLKNFIRAKKDKKKVVNEIVDIIKNGSSLNQKTIRKNGEVSFDEAFSYLLDIGSMSCSSGDLSVFSHFIESLFDVLNEIDGDKRSKLIEAVYNFGFMFAHAHNAYYYDAILRSLERGVTELYGPDEVRAYLEILKMLSINSLREGFEAGVQKALTIIRGLNGHFVERGQEISNLYLKSVLIHILSKVDELKLKDLKYAILNEAGDIIRFNSHNLKPT